AAAKRRPPGMTSGGDIVVPGGSTCSSRLAHTRLWTSSARPTRLSSADRRRMRSHSLKVSRSHSSSWRKISSPSPRPRDARRSSGKRRNAARRWTSCALTEEHNYWLDRRNHANMGRAARAFGARLVRDGVLRNREQIFLLYVDEVRDALRAPRDLSALIAEREAEQERWRGLEAPETIGDPESGVGPKAGAMWHLLYREVQDDPSRALRGAPASA